MACNEGADLCHEWFGGILKKKGSLADIYYMEYSII